MADKFFDKVKFFMGFEEQVEDDKLEENDEFIEKEDELDFDYLRNSNNNGKVVDIRTAAQGMKVIILNPTEFDDTAEIVDNLKAKKAVVVNLEEIDVELARRIFDFCSGALYAIEGQIQKVASGTYLLAPSNIDVAGDVPKNERKASLQRGDKKDRMFPWSR